MANRVYRKKIKKLLAAIMSVSLVMSSVSITTFATESEGTKENPKVTVTVTEIKDGAGNKSNTMITEKEWNEEEIFVPESQPSTEGEEAELPAESEGAEQESESAVQESEGAEQESESAVQESESAEQETQQESQSETTVTGKTTVTGNETTTEKVVTNGSGQVIEESTNVDGNETTTTEITTIETSKTENQVIDTKTENIDETTSTEGETQTTTGQWQEGQTVSGDYDDGTWTDNNWAAGKSNTDGETKTDLEIKNLGNGNADDVTLNLTPGGTAADDTEYVHVSWEDIERGAANIPQAGTEPVYGNDGKQIGTVKTNVTEIKDGSGRVIGYDVTKVTTTTTYGEMNQSSEYEIDSTTNEATASRPELPAGVEAGTKDLKDAEGNVIGNIETTITEIKDDAGNVIGYTITETTTKDYHNETSAESGRETTTENAAPVESFVLPEKPEAGESTNAETGVKTVTTVEDIIEGGKHVGYKSITVKTDANGKELSRSSESVYGTTTVINETTVTDPTTEITTTDKTTVTTKTTTIMGTTTTRDVTLGVTQTTDREIIEVTENDSWEMVEVDGQMYFMYQGYMYAVVAESGHGTLTNNVEVNTDLNAYAPNGSNDVRPNPNDGGGYTGQIFLNPTVTGNGVQYVGYGLYSNFLINDTDGKGHDVRQYAVKDSSGNINYVYCVELGTALTNGAYYNEYKMTDGNLYQNNNGDVEKLNSVAQNGFWGTTDGIGSLVAVKDLLTRNGYGSVANSLTAGQALAATQAAIWQYGTDGTKRVDGSDLLYAEFTDAVGSGTGGVNWPANISQTDKTNIATLYNLLVNLANNTSGAGIAEKIEAEDITGATIVLDKKVEDKADNDIYEADLSFTLAVSTSSINGDLIVNVIQDGKVIETRRLAGDDSSRNWGKITPDANGTYTIEDIQLAEGVNITLKLSGTQHLADGVYIYQNSSVQDFIGLSKLEHDVNLSVDMVFTVEEPDVDLKHNGSDSTRTKNDTLTQEQVSSRTDIREDYTTKTDTTTSVDGQSVTVVYADVTVVEVTTETQITKNQWGSSQKQTYTYSSGDDNNDNNNNNTPNDSRGNEYDPVVISDEGTPLAGDPIVDVITDGPAVLGAYEILDDPVPLGNMNLQVLPMTGDVSVIWMLLSALSGLALAGMSLVDKKRKK